MNEEDVSDEDGETISKEAIFNLEVTANEKKEDVIEGVKQKDEVLKRKEGLILSSQKSSIYDFSDGYLKDDNDKADFTVWEREDFEEL